VVHRRQWMWQGPVLLLEIGSQMMLLSYLLLLWMLLLLTWLLCELPMLPMGLDL